MKKLFAFLLCMISYTTQAGDLFLDSTTYSKHFFTNKSHNENNFGLGLTYQTGEHSEVRVGYYKNSYFKQSEYVLVNLFNEYSGTYYDPRWTIRYGIAIGGVHGYDGTDGELPITIGTIQPAIVPNIVVGYCQFRATIGVLGNAAALQLQVLIN